VNRAAEALPPTVIRCTRADVSTAIEVALLHWPRDREARDRLANAMLPRLLLVAEGDRPPEQTDPMEDWIRLPADERDVAARLGSLSERATRSWEHMVVVDGRCLQRGTSSIPLSPAEAAFATLLVAVPGRLVPRAELVRAIWTGDGRPGAGALDDIAYRLRKRLGTLGLDLVAARGRGFALHVLSPIHPGMIE
jgi:two-component system response regulator TctD